MNFSCHTLFYTICASMQTTVLLIIKASWIHSEPHEQPEIYEVRLQPVSRGSTFQHNCVDIANGTKNGMHMPTCFMLHLIACSAHDRLVHSPLQCSVAYMSWLRVVKGHVFSTCLVETQTHAVLRLLDPKAKYPEGLDSTGRDSMKRHF